MYGFGANSSGQLGMGTQTLVPTPTRIDNIDSPADAVACGATHTVVLAGNQVIGKAVRVTKVKLAICLQRYPSGKIQLNCENTCPNIICWMRMKTAEGYIIIDTINNLPKPSFILFKLAICNLFMSLFLNRCSLVENTWTVSLADARLTSPKILLHQKTLSHRRYSKIITNSRSDRS